MEFPKEKSPCTSSTTPADTPPVKTDQQPGAAKVDLGPLGLTGRWLSSQAQAKLVETAEPVKPVLQRSKQMEMEMEAGDVDDVPDNGTIFYERNEMEKASERGDAKENDDLNEAPLMEGSGEEPEASLAHAGCADAAGLMEASDEEPEASLVHAGGADAAGLEASEEPEASLVHTRGADAAGLTEASEEPEASLVHAGGGDAAGLMEASEEPEASLVHAGGADAAGLMEEDGQEEATNMDIEEGNAKAVGKEEEAVTMEDPCRKILKIQEIRNNRGCMEQKKPHEYVAIEKPDGWDDLAACQQPKTPKKRGRKPKAAKAAAEPEEEALEKPKVAAAKAKTAKAKAVAEPKGTAKVKAKAKAKCTPKAKAKTGAKAAEKAAEKADESNAEDAEDTDGAKAKPAKKAGPKAKAAMAGKKKKKDAENADGALNKAKTAKKAAGPKPEQAKDADEAKAEDAAKGSVKTGKRARGEALDCPVAEAARLKKIRKSKAYHLALQEARVRDLEEEECKELARAASWLYYGRFISCHVVYAL